MGDFLDKIMKRLNAAKGQSNAINNGRTMTGEHPNQILVNPDVQMRTESFAKFISYKILNEENRGITYEGKFHDVLKNDNMISSDEKPPGSTKGIDFSLLNKREKAGEDEPNVYHGEVKHSGTRAAFGQLTLNHDPEKGEWHISDNVRRQHPEFARAIENSHHESGKSFLDHINETVPPPTRGTRSLSGQSNVYSQETDLSPMHAYLKDHGVDVLHVGTHGTYRAGLSQEKDRTGTNLPPATGTGRFRVRGKHSSGNLTVQFSPTQLNPSNINLENQEDRNSIKKALGHTDQTTQTATPPSTAPTKWAESVDPTNMHRRHHVMFFGRVNPPHAGHEVAYNLVKKLAKKYNGTSSMILSRTHDNKKNPLTPEQKEEHAKKAFPDVVTQVADKDHPTLLHQLSRLHENGVTDLHMVAGSDRIPEYEKLINQYNGQHGTHGYYNFKSVNLHSAGERDPDAEGTAGVSASNQRLHAQNGKYENFAAGAPSTMKPDDVKKMYDDVRSGLAPPKPSKEKPCDKCGRVGCKVHKD